MIPHDGQPGISNYCNCGRTGCPDVCLQLRRIDANERRFYKINIAEKTKSKLRKEFNSWKERRQHLIEKFGDHHDHRH